MRPSAFAARLCLTLLMAAAAPPPATAENAPPKGFVLDGDSITDGYGARPNYPDHLAAITGLGIVNLGVSGRHLSEMTATFESRGLAGLHDPRHRDTLVILGGINDILHDPATTPGTLRRLLTDYARKARAAGFRVVVVTLLPVAGLPPGMDAVRTAHNAWMRRQWHGFADALADPASVPELAVPTDPRHFADGLHPTPEGLRLLARTIASAAFGR